MSAQHPSAEPPGHGYRDVSFPPVELAVEQREDGTLLLRHAATLQSFDPGIVRCLLENACATPDRVVYAQRRVESDGSRGDWQRQDFRTTANRVESIGQWFLDRHRADEPRLLILSGNSVAQATLRLGAMAAGVPVCPISATYSLAGGDFARLRYVVDLIRPSAIFVESVAPFAPALEAIGLTGRTLITADSAAGRLSAVPYDEIVATAPTDVIRTRIDEASPDRHVAYMLTSGSTGMPKAVIQTERMIATNLHQAWQILGKAAGWNDIMLDWLPWNHVSGAFNMYAAAVFGGSLYIDDGKPVPGLFDETLRNLREIAVPYFCNVPAGYAALVDALERDSQLRKTFFSRLRLLLYGGAGLPQPVYDRLQRMAVDETGGRLFMTTGYGATETASGCMAIYFDTDKVGIGLPLPGLDLKLVPSGDRYEVRLRGDNVTPGYLDDAGKTAEAFDDEGYYRTGDAARFHDPDRPESGLAFAGRLAEEFKLGTGTWVYGGQVRARLIEALAPAVSDIVLCGIGRNSIGVLGIPNTNGLRQIARNESAELASLKADPKVRAWLLDVLQQYNARYPGSSTAVARFAFTDRLPDASRHELSDKGTVNQTIAMENRRDEIDELYSETPGEHVLVIAPGR